ncbi:MAG: DUF1819 family protein [Methylomonas sp.]|nr:DUF1819 family protein [Methylomonas sp.]PPD21706.1 MAG: hypothetical protein CTY23_04900 [Methylomonas sp.]
MSKTELDKAKHYIRDLVSGSLFVAESKIVAQSLLLDCTEDEWVQIITQDNLLRKKSPNTAIRYARTIKRRLEPLGKPFTEAVMDATDPLYTQLLLLALLIYTPVVADFMTHIVAETKRVYKPNLASDAWDVFLHDRSRTLPGLYDLSDSTLKKTGTNVIRALVEAGYLDNNKNRRLQPVYLLPETKFWLQKLNREDLEPVMECTL